MVAGAGLAGAMSMRTIVNACLLVSAVVLAAFLLSDKGSPVVAEPPPLTALDPAAIDIIKIKRHEQNDIVLRRHRTAGTARWEMQAPFNLPADTARVRSLLDLARTPSYERFSVSDNELTPFMLAVARVAVVFDNNIRIAFGANHPLDDNLRYVLVGDRVHIVADRVFHQLQTSATFFLDPKLVPTDGRLVSVRLPDGIVYRRETGDGMRIVEAWQQLEATTVRRYEAVEPLDTVILTLATGEQITLVMISDRPNLILAKPEHGIQYHISGTLTDALFPAVAD